MSGQGGLERVFRPGAIALVGASERSMWSSLVLNNLRRSGFSGRILLVNRKGAPVRGQPAATSCRELGERIDAALLLVPAEAIPEALEDAAAAGAAGAVVLSAGYAETGEEGRARQQALAKTARGLGVRLIGPNCLGFLNLTDQTSLWAGRLRRPRPGGRVAIVSQSGAVASQMSQFAAMQGIGFTYLVSTGNEADVDVADVIDYLADQGETRAIGLFMESVRRPQAFADAVTRARDAGQAVVALKVGRSEVTAKSAAAHTGSLVGDDRVFSAVCRDLGVVRVSSIEQLVATADMLAWLGKPFRAKPGLGIVAMSGGVCSISSDAAWGAGLQVPALAPATVAALKGMLPDFATPQNPLDLTGNAMAETRLFVDGVKALGNDPGVGAVICAMDAPFDIKESDWHFGIMRGMQPVAEAMPAPLILASNSMAPLDAEIRQAIEVIGVTYMGCGVDQAIGAMAAAASAAGHRRRPVRLGAGDDGTAPRPAGERGALEHLAGFGVPVIPAELATSPAHAETLVRAMGGPAALKIASPDVAHKTDAGGVALNVRAEDAAQAFERIIASVRRAHPRARIDGVLVSPMRSGGVELLVGVARDPAWGLTLSLGMGGALVELLKDTSLRLLPIEAEDVTAMLDELKGKALLDGFRGAPAVDREALVKAVLGVAQAAMALGPQLAAFEVNPLLATAKGCEALDALAVWADPA